MKFRSATKKVFVLIAASVFFVNAFSPAPAKAASMLEYALLSSLIANAIAGKHDTAQAQRIRVCASATAQSTAAAAAANAAYMNFYVDSAEYVGCRSKGGECAAEYARIEIARAAYAASLTSAKGLEAYRVNVCAQPTQTFQNVGPAIN